MEKYVWNSYLLQKCQDAVHPDWLLFLIHGFVDQKSILCQFTNEYILKFLKSVGSKKFYQDNEKFLYEETMNNQNVTSASLVYLLMCFFFLSVNYGNCFVTCCISWCIWVWFICLNRGTILMHKKIWIVSHRCTS